MAGQGKRARTHSLEDFLASLLLFYVRKTGIDSVLASNRRRQYDQNEYGSIISRVVSCYYS